MNFQTKLRAWINRDDGRYYQVGNTKLRWYEIAGYLSVVVAVGLYGIPQMALLGFKQFSIIFLIAGAVLLIGGPLFFSEDDDEGKV